MKKINFSLADRLRKKEKKIRVYLIIFFIVGIAGFSLPITSNFFTHLTPFALLLCVIALVIFHETENHKKSLLIFILIYIAGFLVEVAGVTSGFIFGNYNYGRGLGIKLFDTPLIIGINWIFLVYCTGIIVSSFPVNNTLKILSASLLMVFYDLVLEQIAPALDMWEFEGGYAPVQNYISWLLISLIFHLSVRSSGIKSENRMAGFVFILQLAFFVSLFIIQRFTK